MVFLMNPVPADRAGGFFRPEEESAKREISSSTLGHKIRQLAGSLMRKVSFNVSFNWSTHIAAEHMSQGALAGNTSSFAIGKTIKLLESMQSDDHLIADLKYAQGVAKQKENLLILPRSIANRVKKDIENLDVGKSLAIPSDCSGHAMLLHITCVSETDKGAKTFRVVQHNEGKGLSYHYSKVNEEGKLLHQTGLIFEEVKGEKLFGKESTFLKDLFNNADFLKKGSIETLYEKILPQLGGKLLLPLEDDHLWSHGQLGGSCTARCCLSLIRSGMTKDKYSAFKETARSEIALKSYASIKRGWGDNATRKAVTLEVVKGLERGYEKKGELLPEEFQKIKLELEKSLKKEDVATPKASPKSGGERLRAAFETMERENWSLSSLEKSQHYLLQSLKDLKSMPENEVKGFVKIASRMTRLSKAKLTREQLYVLTALSSALLDGLEKNENAKGQIKKIEAFALRMNQKFNALHMGASASFKKGPFSEQIERYQGIFFRSKGPEISPKMGKMIGKMRSTAFRNLDRMAAEKWLKLENVNDRLRQESSIGFIVRKSSKGIEYQAVTARAFNGEVKHFLFKEKVPKSFVMCKDDGSEIKEKTFKSVAEMIQSEMKTSGNVLPIEKLFPLSS